jgi:hypothetical protein
MKTASKHLWAGWYGFLITPVLALIALQTKFTMVSWACGTKRDWAIHFVAVAFVLLTALGSVLAHRNWRALGSIRKLDGVSGDQWISFVLVLGMLMSILSTVLLLAMWVVNFFMEACD